MCGVHIVMARQDIFFGYVLPNHIVCNNLCLYKCFYTQEIPFKSNSLHGGETLILMQYVETTGFLALISLYGQLNTVLLEVNYIKCS